MKPSVTVYPVRETWNRLQIYDWMHPSCGPLPQYSCVVKTKTDAYAVAIWEFPHHILTALECPEKPTGRGAILWTARWERDENDRLLNPHDHYVPVTRPLKSYAGLEEFLADFGPAVVKDAEDTPLGSVCRGLAAFKERATKNFRNTHT